MTEPWVYVEKFTEHLDVTLDSTYRWIDGKRLPVRCRGRLQGLKFSGRNTRVRHVAVDEEQGRSTDEPVGHG